jgi:hypothetical protein
METVSMVFNGLGRIQHSPSRLSAIDVDGVSMREPMSLKASTPTAATFY